MSVQAEAQMVSVQEDAFLNSSSNVIGTLNLGEKKNDKEKVNSVLNIIDDTILNRDKRSLNEPTTIRKNGITIGKNNTTSQALARVS